MNWEVICKLNLNNPDLSFKNFFNAITYQLDEFAPYKKVTKKFKFKLMLKPWISKEILQKCKNRDSILKSISKENDPIKKSALRNDYKKLRNEITKDKRDSKKSYYVTYFEKNKLKSSEIWKGIRNLVNDKNNLVSDQSKISHTFNGYIS